MSFEFNSQIKQDETGKEYSIQIKTDSYEQFLFMQNAARDCIDGKYPRNREVNKNTPDLSSIHTMSLDSIPPCCRVCPNHPSNGGSGVCNCVAPYLTSTSPIDTNYSITSDFGRSDNEKV